MVMGVEIEKEIIKTTCFSFFLEDNINLNKFSTLFNFFTLISMKN